MSSLDPGVARLMRLSLQTSTGGLPGIGPAHGLQGAAARQSLGTTIAQLGRASIITMLGPDCAKEALRGFLSPASVGGGLPQMRDEGLGPGDGNGIRSLEAGERRLVLTGPTQVSSSMGRLLDSGHHAATHAEAEQITTTQATGRWAKVGIQP